MIWAVTRKTPDQKSGVFCFYCFDPMAKDQNLVLCVNSNYKHQEGEYAVTITQ